MQLPLLMVPPDTDRWSFSADSEFALATGKRAGEGLPALIRRHLGAFGPASAADVHGRAGLTGLEDAMERMAADRARIQRGRRTPYALPDAPRPGEDAPAPPRLLPEFDNLMLAHQDRTRVSTDDRRKALATKNLRIQATFLVDGEVAGSWAVKASRGTATLTLSSFAPDRKSTRLNSSHLVISYAVFC